MRPYQNSGLVQGGPADVALVQALQTDLRQLGYLAGPIDGAFGRGTAQAVRALQWDLMRNTGASTGGDGPAPVAVTAYNKGVAAVTGLVDAALAASIDALLAEPLFPKMPHSGHSLAQNQAALAMVVGNRSAVAPTPYVLAIMKQESGYRHFSIPTASNPDGYITLGLDRNGEADRITSRGYGLGQYTLFHHPPRPDEVAGVMTDPLRNAQAAYAELRSKFDTELVGATPGTRADDRDAEQPLLDLRQCRYGPQDPRFMLDCRACAQAARKLDIGPATPLFAGSAQTYGQASSYPDRSYAGVPDRADIKCDWPYAVRRYNGSGPNSFNYQAIVLQALLAGPPAVASVA